MLSKAIFMKLLSHKTAKPSHYNKEAEHYDQFNEENSKIINQTIENILKKHGVKRVLDFTCGTGSQVFWLAKKGFEVLGVDINAKMLKIARDKAKKEKLGVHFVQGNMIEVQTFGLFDSVITIFNSIGHLTKSDFAKTIQNIYKNLKLGGIYIFDIFNLDYLLHDNNITKLTIDWQTINDGIKARVVQYNKS